MIRCIGVAILSIAWLGSPSFSSAQPAKDDALGALNETVRTAYRQAREALLAQAGPVILYDGESLLLLRGKERQVAPLDMKLYHQLKAVAHAPMGLYLLLAPRGAGDLSKERLDELAKLRAAIVLAGKSLDPIFKDEQLGRQRSILERTLAYLDDVAKKGKFKADDVDKFARSMMPLLQENANESAQAQIDAFHKQILAWRKVLTAEDWSRLKVVIQGSQMPRKDNLAVQYFARWLGAKGEGRRILYAESLWEEQKALGLLGTHLLDTEIGAAFFGDPQRMHRDLLGDAAKSYLDRLKFE